MTRATLVYTRGRVRFGSTRWAVLGVLVACGSVAWADNAADEADIAFGLGNKHYARREYEPALSQYFLSYRLVPNRNVLFNIAHCYEALSRFDEAYRYYYDLSVDPSLSDSDRKDVKVALTRLGPRVALISVKTTPPGADLYIDREDLGSHGKTPQVIAVPPGPHTVVVKLPGYHDATGKVTTLKGKEAPQALTLERIVGRVELTGTPEGAVIRETSDGPELGRLPATLALVPGQKLLVVQAPGFSPSQVLVDVKAGQTVSSKVQLVEKLKPVGKVIVTANRDAASVRVDGQESGFTPTVVTLSEGPHRIEIVAEEAVPFVKDIDVKADAEERLAVELRYAPPPVTAASKSALSVDQAPASVSVITREEIESFGYQTLPEALRAVRGMYFSDDHLYTYIGLRGFAPPGDLNTRILILYDGHAINDTWAGQGYAGREFDVDLNEIDRIEVVRGPASILYGTAATFGVINVVPREHLAKNRHVEGAVATGGMGAVKAHVTGSVGQGDRSFLVSASGLNASGADFTTIENNPDYPGVNEVRGLDGERVLGAAVHAKFDGFTLVAKINQRKKQLPIPTHGAELNVPGTSYTDARGFAELRYDKEVGRVSLSAKASYDASRFRGYYGKRTDDGLGFTRTTDSGGGDWVDAEVRATVKLWSGNRLVAAAEGGGQFLYSQVLGHSTPELHNRFLVSGTLIDEWQITSWLYVQAGARIDHYFDLPEPALSPRGAVVMRPYANGVTKLIGARAFRAPNIYELTYNDDNLTTRTPTAGSLLPEFATSFELEHSHDITPEFRATASVYYNFIDRLISLDAENAPVPLCGSAGSPVQCDVYHNVTGRLTALGAEAELRWQPGRYTMVDASYSFVTLSDATAVYPMHLASARAIVPLREGLLRASGQVTYQSARLDYAGRQAGSALMLNFGLSGDFGPVRYFAGVQNLLDERINLPVTSEVGNMVISQYGRTFWLEVAAGF